MTRRRPRPWFKAATWNLRYDVPAKKQRRTLERLRKQGVTLLLLQEFEVPGILDVFRELGWGVFRFGTCAVAWRPSVWTLGAHESVSLSQSGFPRVGGQFWRPVSPSVVLTHKSGRTVEALSYHLPAGVQAHGEPSSATRRLAVTRECMGTMAERARASKADAVLYGGDDNVDETLAFRSWTFMLRARTGLRVIRPPAGTHGRRKIDDFRVKRLKPGRGLVLATPGDHRAHVRRFRFRR